ncbi:MAG TPA: methyltransferase domain-containing protein [Candidatus Tectomicrobia bacterium]|nr:methyltransferase domain-containing protein [Candidatus Tectomicrobia bacterium]
MPEGSGQILNTRSLRTAYRRLADMLRPGLAVLDVGCGTGAITRGMAAAVAPRGLILGVDVDARFIDEARRTHGDIPGLLFAICDAQRLPFRDRFDVVTAARMLQWLANPLWALQSMAAALKPGGWMAILDYNHEKIAWQPPPPQSMQTFYKAFLRWRAEAGMDNAIADHLRDMLADLELEDVVETPQHETTHRIDADFVTRIGLWAEVAASRGHQMVADGIISEVQRATAEAEYRMWMRDSAESQTLYVLSVEGRRAEPANLPVAKLTVTMEAC